MRVFYAHPSSESTRGIFSAVLELSDLFTQRGSTGAQIIAARKDYDTNFRGDWDEWAESTTTAIHAVTRKPRYNLFVIPGRYCGRATARIVQSALEAGRPVFTWDRDQSLQKVTQIEVSDPDDWTTGYHLLVE
jgi:hypothetical protein